MTHTHGRLLSGDVGQVALAPLPLDPTDVHEGTPTTRATALDTVGAAEVGLWEITSGVVSDVEVDEVFVVLSGRGTLDVDGATIDLAPGVAVRLRSGDRTRWTITETLRKLYVA